MADTLSFVFDRLFDWSWFRKGRRPAAPSALHVEEAPRISTHLRRDIGLPDCRNVQDQLRRTMEWRL